MSATSSVKRSAFIGQLVDPAGPAQRRGAFGCGVLGDQSIGLHPAQGRVQRAVGEGPEGAEQTGQPLAQFITVHRGLEQKSENSEFQHRVTSSCIRRYGPATRTAIVSERYIRRQNCRWQSAERHAGVALGVERGASVTLENRGLGVADALDRGVRVQLEVTISAELAGDVDRDFDRFRRSQVSGRFDDQVGRLDLIGLDVERLRRAAQHPDDRLGVERREVDGNGLAALGSGRRITPAAAMV